MRKYTGPDGEEMVVYKDSELPEITDEELARIAAIPDEEIDFSDIPELGDEFWENAKLEMPENKERITLRLDADIVEHFKRDGRGYQTRINAVLRTYVNAQRESKMVARK